MKASLKFNGNCPHLLCKLYRYVGFEVLTPVVMKALCVDCLILVSYLPYS
jgi:hypothetical protein